MMRRASGVREPLYTMEEVAEKLGVNRWAISALSPRYGKPEPEFDGGISSVTNKSRYRMSVARAWWEKIPQDVRDGMIERAKARKLQ